jgi:hypothetical protein
MLQDEIKRKLSQMVSYTQEGIYGFNALFELEKAQNTPNIISYFMDYINYLYQPPDNDIELYHIGQRINECLLILYRDSKIKDNKVSQALYKSLFYDFPNTQNTNLLDRYRIVIEASVGFKNAINIKDKLIIWNLSKVLFEAYNEFLNDLLGYINICAKTSIEKKYNTSILQNSYNAKIDEFNSLKLNYLFPVISNFAKPEIRNAISHSRISPNNENDAIEFTIKIGNLFENKKIDLIEFIGIAAAGTYLPVGYITALATIFVVENGNITDLHLLPDDIKTIFYKSFNNNIN